MKTIQCAHPPHHHNGFVATCRLWTAGGGVYIYKCVCVCVCVCVFVCVTKYEIFLQRNTKSFHQKVLGLLHFGSCQNCMSFANLVAEIH